MKTKSQQSNQLIQYAIMMGGDHDGENAREKMPKVNSKNEKDFIYFGGFRSNAIRIAVNRMIN